MGKKGFGFYSKREYDIFARYTEAFNTLHFETARELVDIVIKGYLESKFDKVILVYNEFKNAAQANIRVEQFLPIISIDEGSEELKTDEKKEEKHILSNFIYEPAVKDIIDYLLPKHLNTQIWRVMLESFASEQAARMTAMEIATTNANELVEILQLNYNRARQTAITKEILEIVGGAEALREST